jgi:hypothetical protein
MKHKVLILTLFMCFAASTVFAGGERDTTPIIVYPDNNDRNIENVRIENVYIENMQSEGQNQPNPRGEVSGGGTRIEPAQARAGHLPVTWEIVSLIRNSGTNNFGDFDFYLSRSFTMKIDELAKNPEFDVNNRSLLIGGQNSPERTVQFDTGLRGKYIDFSETSGEFVILFQVSPENFQLNFKRNEQRDCFNLVSVSVYGKDYSIRVDGELPRLEISGTDSRSTEIRAVPAAADQGGAAPSGSNYSAVQIHQEQYAGNTYWGRPSREIMGTGSVTKEGVIQYIRSKNSNPALSSRDIGRLIDIYFDEAGFENINRDIAIAQMLQATNFLSNQRTANYNYGGLSPTSVWNGRFRDMTTGVMAHIQHLKGYASTSRPRGQLVDPRYQVLVDLGYRGSVKTFDQLYRRWSENPNYRNEIETILNGLYRFSGY